MDLITLADVPELPGSDAKPRTTIAIGRLDANLRDPRYGKFAITQADVDSWKRNLAGVFGGQVSFDFDHSSDRGSGTRAAAWITSIDQTGTSDGSLITADVEFTRRGAKAVRNGDYKYTSPTFVENYTDEHGVKHGKALIGGALTNRPVLRKGMPTLSLSKDPVAGAATIQTSSKRERKRAREQARALATASAKTRKRTATLKGKGKPEFPMPDLEHARLALKFVKRSQAAGNITPADAAKIRARANAMLGKKAKANKQLARDSRPMDLAELAKLLDLPADADQATVLAKVATMPADSSPGAKSATPGSPPPPSPKATKKAKKQKKAGKQILSLADGTTALSAEQLADLITAANAGQAASLQLAEQTFDAAWSKALSEGRAAPSQEDTMRALYRENSELAVKTLDSFVQIVPVKPAGSGEGAPAGPAPLGMDDDRFALHTQAKALAQEKRKANPQLDEAEAYSLAVFEIEDRKFLTENPGI